MINQANLSLQNFLSSRETSIRGWIKPLVDKITNECLCHCLPQLVLKVSHVIHVLLLVVVPAEVPGGRKVDVPYSAYLELFRCWRSHESQFKSVQHWRPFLAPNFILIRSLSLFKQNENFSLRCWHSFFYKFFFSSLKQYSPGPA